MLTCLRALPADALDDHCAALSAFKLQLLEVQLVGSPPATPASPIPAATTDTQFVGDRGPAPSEDMPVPADAMPVPADAASLEDSAPAPAEDMPVLADAASLEDSAPAKDPPVPADTQREDSVGSPVPTAAAAAPLEDSTAAKDPPVPTDTQCEDSAPSPAQPPVPTAAAAPAAATPLEYSAPTEGITDGSAPPPVPAAAAAAATAATPLEYSAPAEDSADGSRSLPPDDEAAPDASAAAHPLPPAASILIGFQSAGDTANGAAEHAEVSTALPISGADQPTDLDREGLQEGAASDGALAARQTCAQARADPAATDAAVTDAAVSEREPNGMAAPPTSAAGADGDEHKQVGHEDGKVSSTAGTDRDAQLPSAAASAPTFYTSTPESAAHALGTPGSASHTAGLGTGAAAQGSVAEMGTTAAPFAAAPFVADVGTGTAAAQGSAAEVGTSAASFAADVGTGAAAAQGSAAASAAAGDAQSPGAAWDLVAARDSAEMNRLPPTAEANGHAPDRTQPPDASGLKALRPGASGLEARPSGEQDVGTTETATDGAASLSPSSGSGASPLGEAAATPLNSESTESGSSTGAACRGLSDDRAAAETRSSDAADVLPAAVGLAEDELVSTSDCRRDHADAVPASEVELRDAQVAGSQGVPDEALSLAKEKVHGLPEPQ